MRIAVNGVEISDAAVEQELPHHQQAANPLRQSVEELVLRSVLLQEAQRLGISGPIEEARIEALLEREVAVPTADESACRLYYDNHRQRYTSGELVEARHILFQVTPGVSLELLRE